MANVKILQPDAISRGNSLLIALLMSIILHACILLVMKLNAKDVVLEDKSVQVTLVSVPSMRIQKRVQALAMLNQEGGGQKRRKPEPPQKQQPTSGQSTRHVEAKAPIPEVKPQAAPKIISQKITVAKPMVTAEKHATVEPVKEAVTPTPMISPEDLQAQIAQLGREIAKKAPSEDDTRIKFINSISAHQYLAAQYIADWQNKVERMGNLNYPEIARKKGFSGKLTLDVGVKADGSIYSMRISKSSGYAELDDAAQKIVRMSAPFAALPKALLEEVDVLVIKRVWSFSDESGVTTD